MRFRGSILVPFLVGFHLSATAACAGGAETSDAGTGNPGTTSGTGGTGGTGGAEAAGGSEGGVDAGPACVAQVGLGELHTCALKPDGSVWCWGYDTHGELGTGVVGASTPSPTEVASLGSDVADVVAGGYHTCARKAAGSLWCWGRNWSGAVGDGTTSELDDSKPSPVELSTLGATVAKVAAGSAHTCAVRTDGTLWCWGYNGDGELGSETEPTQCPGTDSSLGWCSPSPMQVTAMGADVADVAAGGSSTCALKTDGTVWCWGLNQFGQIGNGSTSDIAFSPVPVTALGSNVAELAIEYAHACARKSDDTLWCWGFNSDGQVGDGDFGYLHTAPSPVQVLSNVARVTTGHYHTCALRTDGTLWCWGDNSSGQLGDGTTEDKPTPTQVGSLGSDVAEVAAGGWRTCALKKDGVLWCWGENTMGLLGNCTVSDAACLQGDHESLPVRATALCGR